MSLFFDKPKPQYDPPFREGAPNSVRCLAYAVAAALSFDTPDITGQEVWDYCVRKKLTGSEGIDLILLQHLVEKFSTTRTAHAAVPVPKGYSNSGYLITRLDEGALIMTYSLRHCRLIYRYSTGPRPRWLQWLVGPNRLAHIYDTQDGLSKEPLSKFRQKTFSEIIPR